MPSHAPPKGINRTVKNLGIYSFIGLALGAGGNHGIFITGTNAGGTA